jgi:hypothetical protein
MVALTVLPAVLKDLSDFPQQSLPTVDLAQQNTAPITGDSAAIERDLDFLMLNAWKSDARGVTNCHSAPR